MKKIGVLFLTIFLAIIGVPALITSFFGKSYYEHNNIISEEKIIKVLDEKTNKIMEIEFEEYIKGVLAAEMPALFELEALKAQAVAARTYAIKKIEQKSEANLKGADISTDFSKGQAYLSKDELKEKWGENFEAYYNRISLAVEETKGEIMTYEEEPIEAVFHSTSAGFTQSAKDIWDVDVPYLKSVESQGDIESPVFKDEQKISKQKIVNLLKERYPDIIINDLVGEFQIVERSSGGYVKKIQIGNKLISGEEIRDIFNLKSSCFSVQEEGDSLIFITKGYGHGAGMSQYGANYMAKQGKTYKDILKHYYQNIDIININEVNENLLDNE
ncbi:stage II sporulation protein D [Defluviitalea phaphyphila]|uniref:stage II sporulation protein D n=1 Tax=Defluviitalea phaphyphila TaxID=1473580 RepID=UPI0007314E42|nr:stage II sporulation protein D [Defluviitalea phaphyphila]